MQFPVPQNLVTSLPEKNVWISTLLCYHIIIYNFYALHSDFLDFLFVSYFNFEILKFKYLKI